MSDSERSAPTVYANNVNAHVSAFDFTLDFRLVGPGQDGGEQVSDLVVRVHLGPPLAKALHEILGQMIASYEATVGPISSGAEGEDEDE